MHSLRDEEEIRRQQLMNLFVQLGIFDLYKNEDH